jgi:hypothetical protein
MRWAIQKSNSLQAWRVLRNLCVLGLLLTVLSGSRAFAQEFRASITGQVADPSGAVIPGATIMAVNTETRLMYSTKSDKDGVYSLLYLLPGQYTVTVQAASFQTMTYNKVILSSAQQLGLNVALKTGAVTEQVIVTAGAVDLDTVSASTGGVLDQVEVENMPSTGHMAWDDLDFTQGIRATAGSNPFNLTLRNNSNQYGVSGAQPDENIFYVNGAPVSDKGSWYFTPNQNSVQQMQASVMPYDAQYGRTGGGAFSANVKAGTNAYHGDVYDYYGNAALNANSYINNLSGLSKTRSIPDTFGAAVGGPIRKNKTFFFGSYEGFRQDQPITETDSVPLPAWKQGNFQGSGYTVYDPTSTYCSAQTSSGCTTYSRNPFNNDTITSISPIGQAILALYPDPNKPGTTKNYVVRAPTTFRYDQFIGRVDQSFSDNTRIYGLFTLHKNNSFGGANGFPGEANTRTLSPTEDYNIILDLTHVFSPKLVMDLKSSYGHNRTEGVTGVAVQDGFLASKLGFNMPSVATTPHQNIAPAISVSGWTGLIGNTDNGTADADADFSGSMTQLLGRHNLHYGFEFMDIQTAPTGVLGQPNGAFTFNTTYSQQNPLRSVTGSGNAFADILMGYPASGSVSWNTPTFVTMHYYGAFVQDEYQILPRLTLNLGLRWDVNKSPRDRHDRINAGFCLTCANPLAAQIPSSPYLQTPLVGGLQFAGVNGVSSTPFAVHWNDWQPRVGFSWAALRDTVVRGGYGIYFPWAPLDVDDAGFSQTTGYVASPNGGLNPTNYLNSGTPYPNGAIAPTGASLGLQTDAGNGISYNDTDRRLRMTQHWSLGVQRRLPKAFLLDVEYLGTNVHGIPVTTSLGVISTAQQQACAANASLCTATVSNPFYGVLPANSSLGASSTIPIWELKRAYPLFNGVSEQRVPSGDSSYNALAVRVDRNVKSLHMVFNYTYSNWMEHTSYLNNGNFRDANLWKGLDPNDMRNYVDANVVYPLPKIHANRLLNAVVNGWLVDSTVIWGTGSPLSLPSATFNFGLPGCSSYAPVGGQTRAHWFNNNESCWTQLQTWQARTTPLMIGFLRNPDVYGWNPAVNRVFPLKFEGMTAQFRMAALDITNTPHFGGPSTAVATPASYTPQTSWTGFGTLPTSQSNNVPRTFDASLIISF